jgi:ATP-dependent helicase Lhr and Lhr-like helicase
MSEQAAGPDPMPDEARPANVAFERLAPFIQEFIWKNGWTEMREIQVRAAAAAFDTDRHLLLAATTASGKTEAAFLPILTQLHENPSASVGVLYIGPLKALINDQFLRLGDLCAEADIPVTAWHGDVTASKKHALLKNPRGILQITPEALEGLLLNRSADLSRLFGDLRWVVIDEVHAFMSSDRGGQVLSLLDRLARYATDRSRLPRRVGLSATLGDYAEAAAWLDGATHRGVEVVDDKHTRTVKLLVDHFTVRPPARESGRLQPVDGQATAPRSIKPRGNGEESSDYPATLPDADDTIHRQAALIGTAYQVTQKHRSLIFTNSRGDAEEIVTGLRRMAEREHTPDIYFVHHGSIAAPLREAAETAMRDGEGPACTAATVTLELGIDLGALDQVLQLGPTATVASFLQRLGRAGRRENPSKMFFLLREEERDVKDPILTRLPWELLQTIAIIQLYAEERWVEPIHRPRLPGSLLYQQTMSTVGAVGELTPALLAARVLTLSPFVNVTQADFREFLLHLVSIDHLEKTPEGGLILGLTGEKVVRNFRFLATFQDSSEWAVKDGTRDVGTVGDAVPIGERLALAGRIWEVMDVIAEQRVLIVRRVKGSLRTLFVGRGGPPVHDRVVERMRRVLEEDVIYPYLTERAVARLSEARAIALAEGLARHPTVALLGGDKVAILPWAGTRVLRTLALWLEQSNAFTMSTVSPGFYLVLTARSEGIDAAVAELRRVASAPCDAAQLVAPLNRLACSTAKYDEFLPEPLLKKSFAADHLDVPGASARLRALVDVPLAGVTQVAS